MSIINRFSSRRRRLDQAFLSARETLPDDLLGEVRIPPVAAALPKRLGSFPFWRGQERFLETMESIYERSSQRGMDVFLGTRPTPNGPS